MLNLVFRLKLIFPKFSYILSIHFSEVHNAPTIGEEWWCYSRGIFHAEPRVWVCFQGKPEGKQGQFLVSVPRTTRPLRSGVFFSFEQALEAGKTLLSRGIISESECNFLLSQAVKLPIFTNNHPLYTLADVWECGKDVLTEVFHDSMREAQKDWPRD